MYSKAKIIGGFTMELIGKLKEKVAVERESERVKMNLTAYLEKGIVK